MGLGNKQSRIYLNVKQGKIYHGQEGYDYIQGYLRGIELKDRPFKGGVVKYWYIDIQTQERILYSLALSYSSGVAKSLFNSLASAQDFNQEVKIQTYQRGEYTKVTVYQGSQRLDWKYKDLPEVRTAIVAGKEVRDDSLRMSFIEELVRDINSRI